MIAIAEARGRVHCVVHGNLCLLGRQQVGLAGLGKEIVTRERIRIESASVTRLRVVVSKAEGDRSHAIETNLVVTTHDGDTLQVIGGAASEHFTDFATAEAVHADPLGIVETHFTKLVISDFIHSGFGNGNLHPFAGSKLGCSRIIRCVKCAGKADTEDGQHHSARELKFSQIAHI